MEEKIVDALNQLNCEHPRVFMIRDGSTFDVLLTKTGDWVEC